MDHQLFKSMSRRALRENLVVHSFSFIATGEVRARLESLAESYGVPRGYLIRALVEDGLSLEKARKALSRPRSYEVLNTNENKISFPISTVMGAELDFVSRQFRCSKSRLVRALILEALIDGDPSGIVAQSQKRDLAFQSRAY